MTNRMSGRFYLAVVALVLFVATLVYTSASFRESDNPVVETFSQSPIQYGASNADVKELQGRLKFLGFFKGQVDGTFGRQTLQALKNFQYKFGMKVDGVAGPKTKLKLWQATKNWRPSVQTKAVNMSSVSGANHAGLTANDMRLMANAVYGEARGEPYVGQVAVAAVILNRLQSAAFPKSISGIIFQPRAFTAVADGQIWLTPNEQAKKAVQDAINGFDPSGGALYYFNPETATSKWIWTRPQILQIGKHIFCM